VLQVRHLAHTAPDLLPRLGELYFRAFSQNGEDGAILQIFAIIGTESRRAVEICAGNCVECNSANLIVNHGWDALLVDADPAMIAQGQEFYSHCADTLSCPPVLRNEWITRENVNEIVANAGFAGEIDLLSLDMDGVDYWIWEALEVVNPRVVVLEYQDILGPDVALTVPYSADFGARGGDENWNYQGASLGAFVKLAKAKGFRLVGTERLGFNAFFVREELAPELLPTVDPADCFGHRKVVEGMRDRYPLIADREWVEV
jgi:hypothetical protein